jgi:hypothetical protein
MDRPPIYPIPSQPEFSGRIVRRAAPILRASEEIEMIDELARLKTERELMLEEIEKLLRWKPVTPLS